MFQATVLGGQSTARVGVFTGAADAWRSLACRSVDDRGRPSIATTFLADRAHAARPGRVDCASRRGGTRETRSYIVAVA